MDISALLDRLENLVSQATKVPLTGKVLIDPDQVLAMIDEIRDVLPEEIRQAQRLSRERDEILREAREEAEAMVRDAKVYVVQLTDETAIAREAQQKADEILDQAKRVAKEIRLGAKNYADEILAKMEGNLEKTLQSIRRSRDELQR